MDANPLKLEWLPGRYAVCRLDAGDEVPVWAAEIGLARNQAAAERSAGDGIALHQAAAERSAAAGRTAETASPTNSPAAPLLSITCTDRELSIVIDETRVPPNVRAQRDFAALCIRGTLDFSQIGILARLTGALAAANVPVCVISTFETDVILMPVEARLRVVDALARVNAIVDL